MTWELRAMAGSPTIPATQTLPDFSYKAILKGDPDARGIILQAFRAMFPKSV